MTGILKISEAASLALHTMVILSKEPPRVFNAKEIALILNASKHHLSKVLKTLERYGLVIAIRGPKGGYILPHDKKDVTLIEIYEAVEGPLEPARCLLKKQLCSGHKCILGNLNSINQQIKDYLGNTKLSDLSHIC